MVCLVTISMLYLSCRGYCLVFLLKYLVNFSNDFFNVTNKTLEDRTQPKIGFKRWDLNNGHRTTYFFGLLFQS